MSIEEIKKRMKYVEANNLFDSHYINDMKSLLSIIEQAEKAFQEITYSENVGAMNAIAEESLQAIRGI